MNSVATKISDLDTLKALQKELSEKKVSLKSAQELAEWEKKTFERNRAYVMGSVRKAVEADTEILGHVHGMVCEIKCEKCGKARLVNKQDAFQVRFCLDCKKVASKEAGKEKRMAKKLASVSKADLEAEIAKLSALLAQTA